MPELAQHITVGVVALAALAVILRRVTGTFSDGRSGSPASSTTPGAPPCSRCAASHAPARKAS